MFLDKQCPNNSTTHNKWAGESHVFFWYHDINKKITKRCLYFWVFLRNHSFEFVCIKHFSKFSLVWDPFFKLISRSSQCPKSHGNLACLSPCRWQAFAQLHISKRLYVLRGHKGYSLMMFDGHFQCIASIYHLASKMLLFDIAVKINDSKPHTLSTRHSNVHLIALRIFVESRVLYVSCAAASGKAFVFQWLTFRSHRGWWDVTWCSNKMQRVNKLTI